MNFDFMTPQLLISIIILFAGFFYFIFPFINKKYFQLTKLTVEIEPNQEIIKNKKII